MKKPLSKWFCTGLISGLGLAAVSGATHNVSITGAFAFSPRVLTVTNGDRVTWMGGAGDHTVSPRSGVPEPFCGPNEVFSCSVTFNTVGSFAYQCNNHRNSPFFMTGAVIVVAMPNAPPLVSITNPLNNTLLAAPATLSVGISASDSNGSVANVRLLTNGVAAATNTSAPFGFTLTNLPAGNYALRARAADNQSLAATSAPVNIRVASRPLITFDRGSNGPIQLRFNSATGVNYVVERAALLTNFSSVATNPGNGGTLQFSETSDGPAQLIYRVRLQ